MSFDGELKLHNLLSFMGESLRAQRSKLVRNLFSNLEKNPAAFERVAWTVSLQLITQLFNLAKKVKYDLGSLWELVTRDLTKFSEVVWRSPLGGIQLFLMSVRWRNQETCRFWEILEDSPAKLRDLILRSSPDDIGIFILEAKKQGREVDYLWSVFESASDDFVTRVWEIRLRGLGVVQQAAKFHGRDFSTIRARFNPDTAWVRDYLKGLSIKELIDLLFKARSLRLSVDSIWSDIESNPPAVSSFAETASVTEVMALLRIAQEDKRNVLDLIIPVTSNQRFVDSILISRLSVVNEIVELCNVRGVEYVEFWKRVKENPALIVEKIPEGSFEDFQKFLILASYSEPKQSIFKEGSRVDLQGPHPIAGEIWKSLVSDKSLLAMLLADIGDVSRFSNLNRRIAIELGSIWLEIERFPEKLVSRLKSHRAPIRLIENLLRIGRSLGRNVLPFWKELESITLKSDAFLLKAAPRLVTMLSLLSVGNANGLGAQKCWTLLEEAGDSLLEDAMANKGPISNLHLILALANSNGWKLRFIDRFFEAQPDWLLDQLAEYQLVSLAKCLHEFKNYGLNIRAMWKEMSFTKIADQMRSSSFDQRSRFLEFAKENLFELTPLWECLEGQLNPMGEEDKTHESSFLPINYRELSLSKILTDFKRRASEDEDLIAGPTPLSSNEARVVGALLWSYKTSTATSLVKKLDSAGVDIKHALREILQRQDRFAEFITPMPLHSLANMLTLLGDSLSGELLGAIPVSHWSNLKSAPSEQMINAVAVAGIAKRLGDEIVYAEVIKVLLIRSEQFDFPVLPNGFRHVVWLLESASSASMELVPNFLDKVCNEAWLSYQYQKAHCGPLAAGLRALAFSHQLAVVRKFINVSLTTRLETEISSFRRVDLERQSSIIQLLGSASLCGCHLHPDVIMKAETEELTRLPHLVLPHPEDAICVQDWQYQLWVGLREVASQLKKPLYIHMQSLERTLELWKENLKSSSINPTSVRCKVDENMVEWLTECVSEGTGQLACRALNVQKRVDSFS
jgi:RNAse (barnase) inhibitor barstar